MLETSSGCAHHKLGVDNILALERGEYALDERVSLMACCETTAYNDECPGTRARARRRSQLSSVTLSSVVMMVLKVMCRCGGGREE